MERAYKASIGLVNHRFKDNIFPRGPAGMMALAVALLTCGTLVLIVFVLHSQCTDVCSTVQLPLVKIADNSRCVKIGLTNDFPIFDGATASGSLVSTTTFGKCSFLHSQPCAIETWNDLATCAAAFDTWVKLADQQDFTTWIGLMVSYDQTYL